MDKKQRPPAGGLFFGGRSITVFIFYEAMRAL